MAAVSMAWPLGKLSVCSGRRLAHSAGRGRATSGLRSWVSSIEPPTDSPNTQAGIRCPRHSSQPTTKTPAAIIGPVLPTIVRKTASLSSTGEAWRRQNNKPKRSKPGPPGR